MRANAAREGEALEELLETLSVEGLIGVHLGVDALEIGLREDSGGTVARARDEDAVKIVLLDETVEVHPCEDLAGSRAKVAEQSKLEVLRLEGFSQEGVVLQVDHTQGQVATGLEEVIVLGNLLLGERGALDSRAGDAKGLDRLDLSHWEVVVRDNC